MTPLEMPDEIEGISVGGDNPLIIDPSVPPTAENVGKFCVDSTGKMYQIRQSDGNTWHRMSPISDGSYIDNLKHIAYGNGVIVVSGSRNTTNSVLYYSEDGGDTWHAGSTIVDYSVGGLTFGGGYFVRAMGSRYSTSSGTTFYKSSDGKNWTDAGSHSWGKATDICYGNGTYVDRAYYDSSKPNIGYSTNLSSWNLVNSDLGGEGKVAYGNGIFVATGYTVVSTSVDGRSWSDNKTVFQPSNYISGIAYGNGMFVVTGYNGESAYSTDGTTWTAISGFQGRGESIAYGGGRFVCINTEGKSYYLDNTSSWAEMEGQLTHPRDIAYCGNYMVAIGDDGSLSKTVSVGTYYYEPLRLDD